MAMKQLGYRVVVGNIGYVSASENELEARVAYQRYVNLSLRGIGRCAGEDVTLFTGDGEILEAHQGETWGKG
jgi:hypothetical protein